jgi:cation diffusion facilitator CzcD-associated flavoprotein CzcO
MGCKRILLSDDFYPALTQDNVELITAGIGEIRPSSIVASDGIERPVDTIILATGFHATDASFAGTVRGRGGRSLAEGWRDGLQAYFGTTVAGFPNLFLCLGPNTGLGHSSVVFMAEAQMRYILDCLRVMERRGLAAVEIRPEVQAAHNAALQRRLRDTVWLSGCASWYLDAHGRNTTLWPGFTWEYQLRTRRFRPADYLLTPRREHASH